MRWIFLNEQFSFFIGSFPPKKVCGATVLFGALTSPIWHSMTYFRYFSHTNREISVAAPTSTKKHQRLQLLQSLNESVQGVDAYQKISVTERLLTDRAYGRGSIGISTWTILKS